MIRPVMYYTSIVGTMFLATLGQLSNTQEPAPVNNKPVPNNQGMYCPAALPSVGEISYDNIDLSGDGEIYIHCPKCSIGVFHSQDNGAVQCTYCGNPQT